MALWYENEVNEIVDYDENGMKPACVQFPAVDSDTVDVEHIEVDSFLQGQDMGGKLMEQLAKRLRNEEEKAVLTRPYTQHQFDGHPENEGLAAE